MTWSTCPVALFVLAGLLSSAHGEKYPKLLFTSCALPGWSCVNDTDGLSSSIASVTYTCSPATVEKTRLAYRPSPRPYPSHYYGYDAPTESYYETYIEETGQDVKFMLTLSDWEKLPLTSITVSGCHELVISMHTVTPIKIHTLRIESTAELTLIRPNAEQLNHPQNIVLTDVGYIPVIPARFIAHQNTKKVEITRTTIGMIKTKAISLQHPLESFEWTTVVTKDMRARSLSVKMEEGAQFHVKNSTFPFMRTASIYVEGGEVLIEDSHFNMIQDASISIYSPFVKFSANQFLSHQGHIFIVSHDVQFVGNYFENYETRNLIEWTTHTTSDAPEQVTFVFNNNTIKLPFLPVPSHKDFGRIDNCFARTTFIEKHNNCSDASIKTSGHRIYGLHKNLTISNLVVCNNICDDSLADNPITSTYVYELCRIPHRWDIVNIWPQPMCIQDQNTELTTPIQEGVTEALSNDVIDPREHSMDG